MSFKIDEATSFSCIQIRTVLLVELLDNYKREDVWFINHAQTISNNKYLLSDFGIGYFSIVLFGYFRSVNETEVLRAAYYAKDRIRFSDYRYCLQDLHEMHTLYQLASL